MKQWKLVVLATAVAAIYLVEWISTGCYYALLVGLLCFDLELSRRKRLNLNPKPKPKPKHPTFQDNRILDADYESLR